MSDNEPKEPSSKETKSRIEIGRGGWVLYEDSRLPARVWLLLTVEEAGELRVERLHIDAPRGIDGTLLREIPVGNILARIRAHPQALLWVKWAKEDDGVKTARLVQQLDAEILGTGGMEAVPAPAEPAALAGMYKQYPGRSKRPDEFYAEVAKAFTNLSATSRRPALDIASYLELPESTVHRWVKEARRRGLFAVSDPDQGAVG